MCFIWWAASLYEWITLLCPKISRVQEFKCSRVQDFNGSRVQEFKGSSVQDFKSSRDQDSLLLILHSTCNNSGTKKLSILYTSNILHMAHNKKEYYAKRKTR